MSTMLQRRRRIRKGRKSVKIPLIMIPGLLCTEVLWRDQVADLGDIAEITVTDAHLRHDDIGAIAGDILAAAPPSFALAGLSFGGYVAFEIMRQAPDRVQRLALLDTTAREDDSERLAQRRDMLELAKKGSFRGMTDRLLPEFVHPDRLADVALINDIKSMSQSVGSEAYFRQQAAIMGRPDSRPTMADIRCPTLVLVGRQDSRTPLAMAEEMHAGIAGSRLVVIEDCGHLATMEQPAAVNAALRDWLTA